MNEQYGYTIDPDYKKRRFSMLSYIIISIVVIVGLALAIVTMCIKTEDIRAKCDEENETLRQNLEKTKGDYDKTKTKLEEANTELNKTKSDLDDTKTELENVTSEMEQQKKNLAAAGDYVVRLDGFCSCDYNQSNIINSPTSSQIRYLCFKVTTSDLKNSGRSKISVDIDIINPDGTLSHNSGTTHTLSCDISASGESRTVGWGNKDTSTYDPGLYRIIFYYNSRIIGGGTIRIKS